MLARVEPLQLGLLIAAGFAAGVVNTLAGGGSLLTVPLLVFFGLPGTVANGTNRVGVLVQNLTSAWRFRAEGVSGLRDALPILVPVVLGSLVGAFGISRLGDDAFERVFGVVMLAMLIPVLRSAGGRAAPRAPWPPWLRSLVFLCVGLYGGAIQAGVGIFMLYALSHAGHDLVRSNAIKAVLVTAFTVVAVPVFVASGQVDWRAAGALVIGFTLGGVAGVRLAVVGGELLIGRVLAVAVVALAGRMLGLY